MWIWLYSNCRVRTTVLEGPFTISRVFHRKNGAAREMVGLKIICTNMLSLQMPWLQSIVFYNSSKNNFSCTLSDVLLYLINGTELYNNNVLYVYTITFQCNNMIQWNNVCPLLRIKTNTQHHLCCFSTPPAPNFLWGWTGWSPVYAIITEC